MPPDAPKVQRMPSVAEVPKHNLAHAEFQHWCKHCVSGRGTGPLHLQFSCENVPPGLVEMDYTY